MHDLGKNILKMVLTGSGYRVVDCGKDCPLPKLIEAAEKEQPLAIGISGLITHDHPAGETGEGSAATSRLWSG